MELSHLVTSDFDQVKTAAFIAAFFINRQALIVLLFHAAGLAIFEATDSGFTASVLLAMLYSVNAAININLSYEIRQALICIACVNWLAAVDYFVSPSETMFYVCYPWLVNGLDVFILYCLLWKGGRSLVGSSRPFNSRIVHL